MVASYVEARDAQLRRMEPITLGYPTEEREYWRDVEPRVLLRTWFGRYARAMRENVRE
jgi:hypothetical protein